MLLLPWDGIGQAFSSYHECHGCMILVKHDLTPFPFFLRDSEALGQLCSPAVVEASLGLDHHRVASSYYFSATASIEVARL